MATNTLLDIDMITKEALAVLENNLVLSKNVVRKYDPSFAVAGAKIGNTLRIRKPPKYVTESGAAITATQDTTESYVNLALTSREKVPLEFSSEDLTLDINDFSEQFIQPAVATLANKIDFDGFALYQSVYNSVGTPGTTPSTLQTYLQGGAKLDFEAAPRDMQRCSIVNPIAQAELVNGISGLFNNPRSISDQYDSGTMEKPNQTGGFKWYMSQNVQQHLVGPLGGTPVVNGASQVGSNLVTDGWTASAALRVRKGDVFTMPGVYAVNPQNRQTTGQLRQFVATADVSSDGSGNATIPISPAINTAASNLQFQTVTASPADGVALTFLGTANTEYPQNLLFHKTGLALGMADLYLPTGEGAMAARASSKKRGLSLRIVRQYSATSDNIICRIDALYGWTVLYPELMCRVWG